MKTTSNLEKKLAAKKDPAKKLGVKAIPVGDRAMLVEGVGEPSEPEVLTAVIENRERIKAKDDMFAPVSMTERLVLSEVPNIPHEETEADWTQLGDIECETSVYAELDSLASEVLEEFGVIGTISPGEGGILYLIRKINTERLVLRDLEAALRAATEIFIKEGK